MADFCKQCTAELFGEDVADKNDFAHFAKQETGLEEGYGYIVLCEGCGPTVVDPKGACVSSECPKHGADMTKISPKAASQFRVGKGDRHYERALVETEGTCVMCGIVDNHDKDCPIRIATEMAYRRPVNFIGHRPEPKPLLEQPTYMRSKFWQWWRDTFGA